MCVCVCVASVCFAGRERGGLMLPTPPSPSSRAMLVSPPPRVRQRGQARRSPILQVGKLRLRLPLPGYLHGYRPGVWTQAPTGGLWVRTDLSCLSFSICQIRRRSNRCELVQVKCLDPAWRVLGAAVLTGASERQPGAEGESGHRVREGLRGPCLVPTGRWPSRRGLAVRCLLLSPA